MVKRRKMTPEQWLELSHELEQVRETLGGLIEKYNGLQPAKWMDRQQRVICELINLSANAKCEAADYINRMKQPGKN